jgi:1,3-beta-glucanosyltransferase GAS1
VTVNGDSVQTNQDFDNLSSQIAKVSPSGVNSASYNPTNSPASCPATGATWAAVATPLPPSPNQQLCSCMYNSLGCVVSGSTSEDDYGQLFGTVCGEGDSICAGIAHNASTGSYGAYGMCNATEQLAYAFNNYYVAQSSGASACNFNGAAVTKAAQSAGGACSTLLAEAGTAGTGTVTSQPSGTGAVAGGSNGGASSASSSSGAGISSVPSPETGLLPAAFIVSVAVISGMGMIFL